MFYKFDSMTIDANFKIFLHISNQINLLIFSTYQFKGFFKLKMLCIKVMMILFKKFISKFF